MGCSGQAATVTIKYYGDGILTKEVGQGVMSKACGDEMGMMKWYCKYMEFTGGRFFDRKNFKAQRAEMEPWFDKAQTDPDFLEYIKQCDHEQWTIKGPDNNDLLVYMVRAKSKKDNKNLGAVINFHGGGAYSGHPRGEITIASRMCVESDVIFFSMSYRLAPEVQYPTGHTDAKAAIEYFMQEEIAEKYGYDVNKICIHGTSGGSWITMGAAILLAREGKAEKVKLMVLACPMIAGRQIDLKKEEMDEWEKMAYFCRAHDFEMHTDDIEKNKNDVLLFPGRAPVDVLKTLPKTVMQTSEFDTIKRDVLMLVGPMKEAGIYLDHMDYSGVQHGFQFNGKEPKTNVFFGDMKKVFDNWLLQ